MSETSHLLSHERSGRIALSGGYLESAADSTLIALGTINATSWKSDPSYTEVAKRLACEVYHELAIDMSVDCPARERR